MNEQTPAIDPGPAQARHGYRNEVNWEGGSGRQPYGNQWSGNQGRRAMPNPAAGGETADGNRRERSGRTQEQLGQIQRKP
ncbi:MULTISPECIES: hypothetical protein [Ramlibacter]|uniref:Uncharacterized protein n=1 Tax=Ramlibacter pinisoli TaxID=2682844 RepID=A0A6N8ISI8_9BURK|nr:MULTISPECIES: hypothetical protein [Ramlibacter]MBA2964906.1 hypothetical protein [Ramlibacter sp. CGMCC 1.13660]MVQ29871.1 hypothetical protein [Ramlibacter pinisoli]